MAKWTPLLFCYLGWLTQSVAVSHLFQDQECYEDSPCLNGGSCVQTNRVIPTCDCDNTPFGGPTCNKDVGTSFNQQMLIYEPQTGLDSIDKNISIGFITRKRGGLIYQLTDDVEDPVKYMVAEMTSTGGVIVRFKFYGDRLQVNARLGYNVNLADGQRHIFRVQRLSEGRIIRLQVDDHVPATERNLGDLFPPGYDFHISAKYILIGRNHSMGTSFDGCIFGAHFGDHYPIKAVFHDPRPNYVSVLPNFESVKEEQCRVSNTSTNSLNGPLYASPEAEGTTHMKAPTTSETVDESSSPY